MLQRAFALRLAMVLTTALAVAAGISVAENAAHSTAFPAPGVALHRQPGPLELARVDVAADKAAQHHGALRATAARLAIQRATAAHAAAVKRAAIKRVAAKRAVAKRAALRRAASLRRMSPAQRRAYLRKEAHAKAVARAQRVRQVRLARSHRRIAAARRAAAAKQAATARAAAKRAQQAQHAQPGKQPQRTQRGKQGAAQPAQPAQPAGKNRPQRGSLQHPLPPRSTPGPARPAAAPLSSRPERSAGFVTRGHYIRSLRNNPPHDTRLMYVLGAGDAGRNAAHNQHMVLLDIGGQVRGGVNLSTTRRFVSYRTLVAAVNAYIDAYHAHQRADAPVTIAIGTNNDLLVNTASGRAWARQVVEPVRAHAARFAAITVAGANDIEPGFSAGPAATRAWLNGYLASTTAKFVFNGSADGCSPVRPLSRCQGGWTTRDLVHFAGWLAPQRTVALPQIYNVTMARQWGQIAKLSTLWHRRITVLGPLTENVACGADPYCPTMPSRDAWRHLWAQLHHQHVAPSSMPIQVDLDVR